MSVFFKDLCHISPIYYLYVLVEEVIRVSGRGDMLGSVHVCVCPSFSTLEAEQFQPFPYYEIVHLPIPPLVLWP